VCFLLVGDYKSRRRIGVVSALFSQFFFCAFSPPPPSIFLRVLWYPKIYSESSLSYLYCSWWPSSKLLNASSRNSKQRPIQKLFITRRIIILLVSVKFVSFCFESALREFPNLFPWFICTYHLFRLLSKTADWLIVFGFTHNRLTSWLFTLII
jgi:hypothetical protein